MNYFEESAELKLTKKDVMALLEHSLNSQLLLGYSTRITQLIVHNRHSKYRITLRLERG